MQPSVLCQQCVQASASKSEGLPGGNTAADSLREAGVADQTPEGRGLKNCQVAEQTPEGRDLKNCQVADDTPEKVTCKRKLSFGGDVKKKRLKTSFYNLGLEKCKAASLTFNNGFQEAHSKDCCPCPSGHWQLFLECLGADKPMSHCKACQGLRDRLLCEPTPPKLEPTPPKLQMCERMLGEARSARGRPKTSAPPFSMNVWLEQNRPGQYKLLPGEKAPCYCVQCKYQFLLQRNSPHYLLLHESKMHAGKAEDVNMVPDNNESNEHCCRGVSVDNGAFAVSKLSSSAYNWYHSGSLMFEKLPGEMCPLHEATWFLAEDGQTLMLRSKKCVGNLCRQACTHCSSLASKIDLQRKLAKWSYHIDLFEYATSLLHSSLEEQELLRKQILERDYVQSQLAGQDVAKIFAKPAPRFDDFFLGACCILLC